LRIAEVNNLAQKAIDSGLWVKQQIDDKKAKLKGTNTKSKGEMVLGLKLCAPNFMDAYKFYWDLGEFYFGLVPKNKGILPAAKACYIVAAENLNTINLIVKDEDQKNANKKKLVELINL
jgi:hypothetical protein